MNTHQEYVTYAQAQALKELGFDWPCECHYAKEDAPDDCVWIANSGQYPTNSLLKDIGGERTTAPTQAVACRWLREEKGLFIDVWLCAAGWSWNIERCGSPECNGTYVAKHDEESGDDEDSGLFTTYDKALLAGLDKALEILKTKQASNK